MLAMVLSGAGCASNTYRGHQAVTLVVDTPSGPVTSTSFQWVEVQLYDTPLVGTGVRREYDAGGGPVILEMGDGHVLFGVLRLAQLVEFVYCDLGRERTQYEAFAAALLPEPQAIDFQYDTLKNRIVFFPVS